MTMRVASGLLALALLGAGCATGPAPVPGDRVLDVERLHEWLTGRFETRGGPQEAARGMLAVPILDREPGYWIYVVQWRDSRDKPERQFVYHLVESGDRGIALELYSLSHPLDQPTDPSPASLSKIVPDALERRAGCRIRLSTDGLSYVGGTRGGDCPADYRGASRLRIELTVRENEVREWLQGYDDEGHRLWNAGDLGRIYRRTGDP